MRTAFRASFERNLKSFKKDHQMLDRIQRVIEEVEAAGGLGELLNAKKLSAGSGDFNRIRVSDDRIGLVLEGDEAIFVRCLHRREIYRYFS